MAQGGARKEIGTTGQIERECGLHGLASTELKPIGLNRMWFLFVDTRIKHLLPSFINSYKQLTVSSLPVGLQ